MSKRKNEREKVYLCIILQYSGRASVKLSNADRVIGQWDEGAAELSAGGKVKESIPGKYSGTTTKVR